MNDNEYGVQFWGNSFPRMADKELYKHHVRYFWKKYVTDWYQIHAELKPGELTEIATFKSEQDARDYVDWKNR